MVRAEFALHEITNSQTADRFTGRRKYGRNRRGHGLRTVSAFFGGGLFTGLESTTRSVMTIVESAISHASPCRQNRPDLILGAYSGFIGTDHEQRASPSPTSPIRPSIAQFSQGK